MASASSLCLTTLEYAIKGNQPVVIHCPSCGIKLIIKHQDSLTSRLTSVTLLVGISIFFCYNVGVKSGLFGRFNETLSRWFGGSGRKRKSSLSSKCSLSHSSNNIMSRHLNSFGDNPVNNYRENAYNCNHNSAELLMNSDQDSGIDLIPNMEHRDSYYYDDDEFDGQFDELLAYNAAYNHQYSNIPNEFYSFNNNGTISNFNGKSSGPNSGLFVPLPEDDDKIQQVKTKTITKIDQVLQSIDDIKKSIVEIDDEIYHIAGSTYDSYSPYFLTLSTPAIDDYDSIESGSKDDGSKDPSNSSSSDKSETKPQNFPHRILNNRKKSRKIRNNVEIDDNSSQKALQDGDKFQRPARTSQSSMSDLEQLEWDFDFELFSPVSTSVPINNEFSLGHETFVESTQDQTQEHKKHDVKSEHSSSSSSKNFHSHAMLSNSLTDEEKLKNMHELLDDAKRMGLLNNIIDALNTESSFQDAFVGDKQSSKHS